jgi:2'-5' RNA ligase
MKYGVAIFPSKKLQDFANSYRKRYDPNYALIPPHITVKTGFEASEDEVKTIVQELRSIAKNAGPFSINVYKIGSFHPVNNVIYLKLKQNEDLQQLHEKLYANRLKTEREYAFVPHITIGQKLSDEEHYDVLESLKMMDIHFEETIDRFQLLYQLENGSWTVYETFLLEGEK